MNILFRQTVPGVLRICERNAWVETENNLMNMYLGICLRWRVCCRGWSLRHYQIMGYSCWRQDDPIRQFVLYENNWLEGYLLNPEGLGSLRLKASAIWRNDFGLGPPWLGKTALFQLYREISFTTEEKHGKPQSGQPGSVRHESYGLASSGLSTIGHPRLPVGDFRQYLVGTSAFHVAELKGSRVGCVLSQCPVVVNNSYVDWRPPLIDWLIVMRWD
jgi:hypothetical protein